MLRERRCPHTGLINYYADDELLLPVASIMKEPQGRFVWRFHIGDGEAGAARTHRAAESALRRVLARNPASDLQTSDDAGRAEVACCH